MTSFRDVVGYLFFRTRRNYPVSLYTRFIRPYTSVTKPSLRRFHPGVWRVSSGDCGAGRPGPEINATKLALTGLRRRSRLVLAPPAL